VVNPILLIAAGLGVAFLLPVIDRAGRVVSRAVHLLTLLFGLIVSLRWLAALTGGAQAAQIITGGWIPPIGINLRFGPLEAALVALANLTAIAAALYLAHHEEQSTVKSLVIQLLLVVGATGLIMTRDLFNTFVFLEISGIGSYALLAFGRERDGLEAGFKYMALGSAASTFFLLGVAFLYKLTGTLNLDDMVGKLSGVTVAGVGTVLLLVMVGLMAELKLFPLNGPAIDIYDAAEPGVNALLVGTTLNALMFTFFKVMALYRGNSWLLAIATVGMTTFVVSNLLAIRQKKVRRMLGYSSSAQMGLMIFLLPFIRTDVVLMSAMALLLLNHTLAKAGLLWLAGIHGGRELDDWRGAFPDSIAMRVSLAALILAIAGLPPFPGFWGKWQALVGLARSTAWPWIIPLLVGSLLELVYYFGWLRRIVEPAGAESRGSLRTAFSEVAGVLLFAGLAIAFGVRLTASVWGGLGNPAILLGIIGLVLVVAQGISQKAQAALSVLAVGWVILRVVQLAHGCPLWDVRGLFLVVALFGALIIAIAGIGMPAGRGSFWGLFLILVGSIVGLLTSDSLLGFFAGWELMTWSSYFLVSQGREGAKPGLLYMLFSGAAGFLILGGLMAAEGAGIDSMAQLGQLSGGTALAAWCLLAAGFAVKVASWGVHIWAPGAYSESPDLFTPFLSGVISKVPVFGLAAVAARISAPAFAAFLGGIEPAHVLAWVGGLTAFGMTLLAVFQEDAKRLLAYSSVGQVGYIVLALAAMTPLGWTAGLWHVVNHLLFKSLLFLAVAGVVYRTGTRRFADMGGLITRMPISFVSVLIGIIALSGVPPLSGFAGKWLLYEALVDRGWLLLTGFMMFASAVAFLYCFRLIHSIFLGQLKREHREIREAPAPLLVSQGLLMVAILALSVRPRLLLEPLQRLVTGIFGQPGLQFASATKITSSLGYFNAAAIMTLVAALFIVLLFFLLFAGPKSRKVGQLDIVYAAEVPPPPEEIHYAWAFYMPYERAFKPILGSTVTAFWSGVKDVTEALADAGRRVYTGDAQTYVLYTLLFILVLAGLGLAG